MKEFFSAEDCRDIFNRIVKMAIGGGDTQVTIVSSWRGASRWARNRIYVASDVRDVWVDIRRIIRGASGSCTTSRFDDEGLLEAVQRAEKFLTVRGESPEQIKDPFIKEDHLKPKIWSDYTYNFDADKRAELVQDLIAEAEDAGFLSAGDFYVSGYGLAVMSTEGIERYYPESSVGCSMTVRHPKALASGWAGVNDYDITRIDPRALAAHALDKCKRSMNPVAMEPGRYTTILEPQATADLFSNAIVGDVLSRPIAEKPYGPYGKAPGRSKINDQILDRRLTVSSDPMDPDGGFIPFDYTGVPYQPVNWMEQGFLRELEYHKRYALAALGRDKALPNPNAYRLSAVTGVPTTTVEEMIAKTEYGILVTRFSNIDVIDGNSLLCSGYTRDGLWLIEGGKISKPIKNFRFTESPLFALNNLEDIGVPQRVFGHSVVAPAVRVRDFSFTSLADSI